MYISRLVLDHFRSWDHCLVDFQPGVNILQGMNGLGKTNIVEAIIVLSMGSSHRVSGSLPLVERGQKSATVRANVIQGRLPGVTEEQEVFLNGHPNSHGTEISTTSYELTITAKGANRARINGGKSVYMKDMVGSVPTVAFTPEDQNLIPGDPSGRRGFLNQAGSLLLSKYWQELQEYERIAKQRAALLRQISDSEGRGLDMQLSGLEIWTGQLVQTGMALTKHRAELVTQLARPFASMYASLAGEGQEASLEYRPSFDEILRYAQPSRAISKHFQRIYQGELVKGQNLIGPHRDDLLVLLNGMNARSFASNGELWTLALAMKMALFEVIFHNTGIKPIVILDDVFAQLDQNRREQILEFAQKQEQVFITVAAASDIPLKDSAKIINVAELKNAQDYSSQDFSEQVEQLKELRTVPAHVIRPSAGGAHDE